MKKLLLFLAMFLFMTNVSALTFNVELTNIEDKGNNGTIGDITNIDVPNKTIDAYFQDIGDEVNFDLTITNSGDRAGTLRSINITSSNDKMEYTHNLPEGGLAINGNDTNTVTVKAKVLAGATNGTSSSEIKITYNYDEGSCPEGEILSDDESMCLCPEGTERNEIGICVVPEKKIECKDDEIYNETKKICEKKVVPAPDKTTPSNPKTMDNIVLITLLFFVSGLGIYAVLFKKLKTKKSKITAATITGITVLTLSFTVLAGVFGLDNLLGAIVNPITKSKEVKVTVNETIDLIETWDGECSLDVSELTSDNIFEGGSGTESDPYQVKTAEQLSCFAKSVNNGTTYQGQFIKQTKNIKLNDDLNDNITAGTTSGLHLWTPAGNTSAGMWDSPNENDKYFAGTYDGDEHTIKGLYLTNDSSDQYRGLFGYAKNATLKNIELSDVYMNTTGYTGALLGYSYENLTVDNVITYGNGVVTDWNRMAGLIAVANGNEVGIIDIEDSTNNIDLTSSGNCSGIILRIEKAKTADTPTIVLKNNINNGDITYTTGINENAGMYGQIYSSDAYVLIDNSVNTGKIYGNISSGSLAGILGYASINNGDFINSSNTGDMENIAFCSHCGMLYGKVYAGGTVNIDNNYNSGNYIPVIEVTGNDPRDYFGGIIGYLNVSNRASITNSYNTGDLAGNNSYMGGIAALVDGDSLVEDCYNIGDITGYGYVGGIVGRANDLNKVYNTGTIHTVKGPMTGGIVGYSANNVTNSYNEGEIVATGTGNMHGGICGNTCNEVKNCYNRGNITISNNAVDVGGIANYAKVTNSYNSGKITYLNDVNSSNRPQVGGITSSGNVTNSYNLGDIELYQRGSLGIGLEVGGISYSSSATNSVNKGNITVIVPEAPTGTSRINISGITATGSSTNSFNAGVLSIDESALDTPVVINNPYSYISQIQFYCSTTVTGNKWNTDANGIAAAYTFGSCTSEHVSAMGQYTTEEAPDILSIINGDNAFNDELDEDGLPTLKAFNN